jgi:uncharacterized membrane protein YfcA
MPAWTLALHARAERDDHRGSRGAHRGDADVSVFGLVLALVVGLVLGILGGGGSLLAVPIFLYVFHVEPKAAIAMSLVVVGMSALVGFITHWRQGTVNVRIAAMFGALAMMGAFAGARVARHVPARVQLGLFTAFAITAAIMMLRDSRRKPAGGDTGEQQPHFSTLLGAEAIGVGVLTALIGAGGGFIIVPALVLVANVPVKAAVGSSLLIIAMNATSAVIGYHGQVAFDWRLVGWFTSVAAVGAVIGTRLVRRLPAARIKQAFAIMILVLGTYLVVRTLTQ